ncbi:DNA polymerase III subunit delta' [Wenxinia marina]|uniref:DNA polymerase III, delta prime subunit n=1 Tax=Wenxinia marina DSM 24838 TaxID=1123501 RepID=A0A0D0NPK8_9RHOB|nr:DNA polymerase III subunit delta' [Wenxinia marina]KIQ70185.1 DNA polymerase III, delta prime subunit [Wenxinia marina DSM 24838]GGL50749.1 DNA polymerase III subunit delta' [Wenxinia marina]
MAEADLPEPDRQEGMPHPREATRLVGQEAAEAAFLSAFASGRLHSGWLITGPRGVGKATLAYRIAAFLLSQPAPGAEAGLFGAPPPPATLDLPPDDPDLRLLRAGAHPRLKILRRGTTEKGDRLAQVITAGVVRSLKDFFHMSSADGGRRVVIVDSADEMNVQAANALLKELEEPPAGATLLLISHQPSALLPTIRSRCRTLRLAPLPAPALAEALTGLGVETRAPEALAVLAAGSVGEAARMHAAGGLDLYADLVALLDRLPRLDRPAAIRLAESAAGRAGETRLGLLLDLIDVFLSRAARAGLAGEPDTQGAPGEARLLARLAPDARAARDWATLQQGLSARARHARAVNIDPAALILDMLFAIEDTARRTVPA